MKRKLVLALLALVGLSSFVVLGNSPELVGNLLESVQNNSLAKVFSTFDQSAKRKEAKQEVENTNSKQLPTAQDISAQEIPERILWQAVFNFSKKIETEARKLNEEGKDGTLYSNYFIRQGNLSVENDEILKDISSKYLEEIESLNQKAEKVIEESRAGRSNEQLDKEQTLPKPPEELKELQKQKDEITLRYRDKFKEIIGEEAFDNFSIFLAQDFSLKATKYQFDAPLKESLSPQGWHAYNIHFYDDETPAVSGLAELYFDYDWGYYYNPKVYSWLRNATTGQVLHFGSHRGLRHITPASVTHPTYPAIRGHTYCTYSEFYAVDLVPLHDENRDIIPPPSSEKSDLRSQLSDLADEPQQENLAEYPLAAAEACHTVPFPPTPTPPPPTPTPPTPTPTPPPCLVEGNLDPCPTPTPTPAPSPTVSITPFEVVEKNGTKDVKVTISNNASGTTKFTLTTTQGTTGTATFENDSSELIVNGNVTDQPLKIKGVTESSQSDNIVIEARVNSNSTVLASDNFTVAVITSLVFEKFESDYTIIDSNPGTDGIPNPDGSEGQRIFPDKEIPTDSKDRSLVKIKATVSPAAPNLKVYFGSYDPDDPSANIAPIDTNGSDGKDNNGQVNGSKSGDFTIVPNTGNMCLSTSISTGTSPNYISKIECPTAADGIATAQYKITMQPGDNIAIAASVDDIYRNSITVNSADGAKLINGANNTIPISGESNPDNVAGSRTKMLTVWRRLHIEVDSMGQAHENYVRGNVSGGRLIYPRRSATINVIAPSLEVNRFENGRMILAWITNFLDIVSNTSDTITVKNSTANDITLANNVNFQLSNQDGTRTAVGTIPVGQAITSMQTVTLSVTGTPLDVNAFSNGRMYITPDLRSLTVTSNTVNSVDVTNTGLMPIVIADATNFRLYDDDDFNDDDGANLNGDEGDNVSEPDLSLLSDNDTPASNVFAPAYVRPKCCLSGSHEEIPFIANIEGTRTSLDTILSNANGNFDNFGTESSNDFWTIYLLGGYQFNEYVIRQDGVRFDIDGDPYTLVDGIVSSTYAAANVSNQPPIRFNDGYGAVIFTELGRPNEYPRDFVSRPVSRSYTTAHEVGHLFMGIHSDGDLMEITQRRTAGKFSDISLSWIRKCEHP